MPDMTGGGYPYGDILKDLISRMMINNPQERVQSALGGAISRGFGMGAAADDPVTDPALAPSWGGPESYSPEDAARISALAKGKIAERAVAEQAAMEQQASAKEEKQKLIEAAAKEKQQREYMQGAVPLKEDYGKGIAIGGQEGRGSAEDIMFRIRAEAMAKGRNGSLKGGTPTNEDYYASASGPRWSGGSLTTTEMTPEIAQRQAQDEIWANQQPVRDAEFAMTPGQSAKRPDDANRATQVLSDLQRNQALTREQAMKSQLVQSLAGSSGKIPFEKAMQLEAAGMSIPYGARGMSKEDAMSAFDAAIEQAGRDLAGANPLEALGNPSAKNEIVVTRYAMSLAQLYKQKVAMGMDPDAAYRKWQEQVAQNMMEAGLLNTNEMVGPAPEAP